MVLITQHIRETNYGDLSHMIITSYNKTTMRFRFHMSLTYLFDAHSLKWMEIYFSAKLIFSWM